MTITRGHPGYRYSPLDKGDHTENRIIADRENAALGGVTAEQEKDMVDGAIFGWEFILYRNGALLPKDKMLQVEISKGAPDGHAPSVILEMPATWAEFWNAIQRARIKGPRHCKNKVLLSRHKLLSKKVIGRNVNLLELNLLAQRLCMLTGEEKFGFDDLLKMEQKKTPGAIPLQRLINLTFSTDQCCVAPNVTSHQDLGQFLWESGMLPEQAMALLDTAEQDDAYRNSLLEVFGKKHLEDEGGVITNRGYVKMSGEIQEVYIPGEMAYFEHSGAPVVVEVRKGFGNGPPAILDLPACEEAVRRALQAVEAVSTDECRFRCVDCLIPAARPLINDAIDREGGIDQAKAYARVLKKKLRVWVEEDIVKYKALLEATGCAGLEDAIKLTEELEQYDFKPETATPWDCAALTGYGLVRRRDGQPLPSSAGNARPLRKGRMPLD